MKQNSELLVAALVAVVALVGLMMPSGSTAGMQVIDVGPTPSYRQGVAVGYADEYTQGQDFGTKIAAECGELDKDRDECCSRSCGDRCGPDENCWRGCQKQCRDLTKYLITPHAENYRRN